MQRNRKHTSRTKSPSLITSAFSQASAFNVLFAKEQETTLQNNITIAHSQCSSSGKETTPQMYTPGFCTQLGTDLQPRRYIRAQRILERLTARVCAPLFGEPFRKGCQPANACVRGPGALYGGALGLEHLQSVHLDLVGFR